MRWQMAVVRRGRRRHTKGATAYRKRRKEGAGRCSDKETGVTAAYRTAAYRTAGQRQFYSMCTITITAILKIMIYYNNTCHIITI